jgi:hypothetical protein
MLHRVRSLSIRPACVRGHRCTPDLWLADVIKLEAFVTCCSKAYEMFGPRLSTVEFGSLQPGSLFKLSHFVLSRPSRCALLLRWTPKDSRARQGDDVWLDLLPGEQASAIERIIYMIPVRGESGLKVESRPHKSQWEDTSIFPQWVDPLRRLRWGAVTALVQM